MKRLALLLALLTSSRALAAERACGPPAPGRGVGSAACIALSGEAGVALAALHVPIFSYGGGIGIPRVITWADTTGTSGIAWGTTAAIGNTTPYLSYSGTTALWNVPTGSTFAITVNGVAQGTFSATTNRFVSASALIGNMAVAQYQTGNNNVQATGGNSLSLMSTKVDSASAVGTYIGDTAALSTAGAKLLSVHDAMNTEEGGSERFALDLSGAALFTSNSSTSPAATNAYLHYDGSNFLINSPATKGLTITRNGVAQLAFDGGGTATQLNGSLRFNGTSPSLLDGTATNRITFATTGATGQTYAATEADGATAISHLFNTNTTLSTAGAKLVSVQNNGAEKLSVDLNGAVQFPAGAAIAAATTAIDADGSGNLLYNVATGKLHALQVNGSSVVQVTGTAFSTTGTIKATSGGTGSAAATQFLSQSYVIDLAAFTAGVDQTSAQTMTGVAFGDACSVGTAADESANIGAMTVLVTSAGNIKISFSPISTTSTANPPSDTYTVKCWR